MKNNDSVACPVKQWRRLAMPPYAWGVDTPQLLHVCGKTIDVRAVMSEQGQQMLEVFCATEDEYAQAESLVHQAAADAVLRKEINSRCGNEIGNLVDSVLKRATGK